MPTLSWSARVSLLSNLLAWVAVGLSWYGFPGSMPFSYATHKALHILGVVIFAGNMFAGPVWLALAWFSGDKTSLANAGRALAAADMLLTAPGVQLAVWNGVCLAAPMGGVFGQPWLTQAVGLVMFATLLGCTLVLYWQEKLVDAAVKGAEHEFRRAMIHWSIWGTAIGVPFGLAYWLMVSKQPLW